jgi:CubicO group peptidase (beta-lactamase class C family)
VPELTADVARDLQARSASFVTEGRLPGAAVGVVYGDDLAWSAGIGLSDVGAGQLPRATTPYRIASVTKTFTGTAIMQLCDAGLLHLDDPAIAHVPELRRAASPFGAIETVTIRRMLAHESGLASEPPGTDFSIPRYQGVAERTLERAADIGTRIPSNLQQKYSNLAYQLLGEIVARASGTPYPRYVNEAILHPLGMSDTSFEPLGEALLARRATGYSPRLFSDELGPAPLMPPMWAEGGLWSCVTDLARWISFQLGAYRAPGAEPQVLPAGRLRDMHKPRYLGDDQWTQAWGISWYAVRRDTEIWIQHSGGLPGFSTNVCFDPKEQVGAIVLLNADANAAELAMDLAAIARDSVRGTAAAAAARLVPAPTPDEFRPLLGIYASPELGRFIRLEWRDGKLTFVDPDAATWRPTLTPTGDPDKFVVEPGFRESGESVIFHRLADGRVASVFLAAATFARMDRVLQG